MDARLSELPLLGPQGLIDHLRQLGVQQLGCHAVSLHAEMRLVVEILGMVLEALIHVDHERVFGTADVQRRLIEGSRLDSRPRSHAGVSRRWLTERYRRARNVPRVVRLAEQPGRRWV